MRSLLLLYVHCEVVTKAECCDRQREKPVFCVKQKFSKTNSKWELRGWYSICPLHFISCLKIRFDRILFQQGTLHTTKVFHSDGLSIVTSEVPPKRFFPSYTPPLLSLHFWWWKKNNAERCIQAPRHQQQRSTLHRGPRGWALFRLPHSRCTSRRSYPQ